MKIFGFEIIRPRKEAEDNLPTVVSEVKDDGAVVVSAGGAYGIHVDLDGTVRSEAELVTKYRTMAMNPEVDTAIEEIVNEAIVTQEGVQPVSIVLDDIHELSDETKQVIEQEFEELLRLLEWGTHSYDIFRRFYTDGRMYYNVIIDPKNAALGISKLRYVDPRKIRKVREVQNVKLAASAPQAATVKKTVNEYYIYNDKGFNAQASTGNFGAASQTSNGIKIAKDSIVHVTSGLTDESGKTVLSWLHKGIKWLNMLRAMEDAILIYRISRAPERRIFYIDVGNLPRQKAEQHIQEIMNKHKNKLVYDASTGQIRDDRKFTTMIEDYWFPRREGSRGTEVVTLPAGQNLSQLEDVEYFQRKLFKALNVPVSRLEPENAVFSGVATEITRDEIRFSRFIDRIRLRFNELFMKLMEKQLVLKNVITPDDWMLFGHRIRFKYARDNHFAEMMENTIMGARIQRLNDLVPFVGKYYSNEWVRRNVLKQDTEDMLAMDEQIEMEKDNPQYQGIDPMTGAPMGMDGQPMGLADPDHVADMAQAQAAGQPDQQAGLQGPSSSIDNPQDLNQQTKKPRRRKLAK